MNYEPAYSEESHGDYGGFGLKILISTDHPLSEKERHALYKCADIIKDATLTESYRLNPAERAIAKLQREHLIGLFPQPIYVEEIPNGYCNRWCCKHLPWFVVTTAKGRITIGWRKRVIEIAWDKSFGADGRTLFPAEQVTVGEGYIHAWGYDKARGYVKTLLEQQGNPSSGPGEREG